MYLLKKMFCRGQERPLVAEVGKEVYLRAPQELDRSHRLIGMKEQTTERISLETKHPRMPFLQRQPKHCSCRIPFAVFHHPEAQRLLLPVQEDLAATQAGRTPWHDPHDANFTGCRKRELQGHGSFLQDVKGKTGRAGSVWKGSVPKSKAPERAVWTRG